MRALLATLLLMIALPGLAAGFGSGARTLGADAAEQTFLPVTEAYRLEVAVREDGGLRLYWQIEEAYYLYQHRFRFALSDDAGDVDLAVRLPQGLEKTDESFGDVVVYYRDADVLLDPARSDGLATLTVTSQGCADAGLCYPPHTETFAIDFDAGTAAPAPPASPRRAGDRTESDAPATRNAPGAASLGYMLLLAFLGGMILNLMPCVFPVLSLKVLSFANSTDHDRHLHSWVYSLGVVVSFVLVAALLLTLKQAGQAIGWGFQLQSPGFVIALAYLFIAMGLSLSGLVHFGGSLMNAGSSLAGRGGLSGSFFTGVLAVVVASPCTAPFMGTALGFAVSQPPAVALLVFAALGAGMAAPLLLFSYSRLARSLMPKPGAWMETLKELLAFPLYATAIWLLWVAGRQTGVDTMASAMAGALMLALGLWLWDQRAWRRAAALACVAAAVGLASVRGVDNSVAGDRHEGRVAWSEHGVNELRGDGVPVFVDVTADWCITCKANEAAVLSTRELAAAFEDGGVVYMVADWTNHDPDIADLLERHGRTGIPLYLMYPGDPDIEPLILPQILTRRVVLDAIDSVAVKKPDVARSFPAG
jgi:thiol:disulfide interchange protein DsbD